MKASLPAIESNFGFGGFQLASKLSQDSKPPATDRRNPCVLKSKRGRLSGCFSDGEGEGGGSGDLKVLKK